MQMEKAIASIEQLADRWVRLEEVRRFSGGLVLFFDIYKGQRGRQVDTWQIECSRVHDAKITALDGGGLGIYSSTHPAARQFIARQLELRWSGSSDEPSVLGALYKAHKEAVDDWIDFDVYSTIRVPSKNKCSCRGPEFLMRAYAKAIRSGGKSPQIALRRPGKKAMRLRVLHFGESYVVANAFSAMRSTPLSLSE